MLLMLQIYFNSEVYLVSGAWLCFINNVWVGLSMVTNKAAASCYSLQAFWRLVQRYYAWPKFDSLWKFSKIVRVTYNNEMRGIKNSNEQNRLSNWRSSFLVHYRGRNENNVHSMRWKCELIRKLKNRFFLFFVRIFTCVRTLNAKS